jgi:hypothetical protein
MCWFKKVVGVFVRFSCATSPMTKPALLVAYPQLISGIYCNGSTFADGKFPVSDPAVIFLNVLVLSLKPTTPSLLVESHFVPFYQWL